MRHDQQLQDTLCDLPLRYRLTHLVASLLVDDAQVSVEVLVGVAIIMAKRLPPEKQTAISWHLKEAIEELTTRWN